MKIMKNFYGQTLLAIVLSIGMFNCTNLKEQVQDNVELEQASSKYATNTQAAASLLSGAYTSLHGPYQSEQGLFALNEHTGDAIVGPTRGGDWDDGGVWRQLHVHTFSPDHTFITNAWVNLYAAINQANLVLGSSTATNQQKAEAGFLRALNYYHCIDLFGSVAYRELGSDPTEDALVYTRSEATDWVISELESLLSNLPNSTDPTMATQNAARFLLAKLYLNKGIFKAESPASPSFADADMDKVISYVDAITGRSIAPNYWDNFREDNNTSPELIFVSENIGGGTGGNLRSQYHQSTHYNQTPGGWNGFTTLGEFYDRFDPNDPRINDSLPDVIAGSGYVMGFQIGQAYGPGGTPALTDRQGNPLVYTKSITLITGGNTLEVAGIRGVKYIPDYDNLSNPDNDYVLARYADALLMKAEALARKGDFTNAQTAVRMLTHESTTTVTTLTDIYDVRARELWWEGHRRNDMIRFGTFLNQKELKPYTSDEKYLLFPIPADAVANPNIAQNPGY